MNIKGVIVGKINSVALSNFAVGNLYQFFVHFKDLVEAYTAESLGVTKQYNSILVPAFNKFDQAYSKVMSSEYTGKISDLSKRREHALSSINGIIKVFSNDIDASVKDSASKLGIALGSYKNIMKKTMNEQTAEVTNRIQIIKLKYMDDVTKLNMTKWLTELESANNELDGLIKVRYTETAERGKVNTEEAKRELIAAYRNICKLIEVYMFSEGDEIYGDFVRNLNAIIASYPAAQNTAKKQDKPAAPEGENPVEEKYPTAKEWTKMVAPDDFKKDDICFVIIEDKKSYYKMIDEYYFGINPAGEEGKEGWEFIESITISNPQPKP